MIQTALHGDGPSPVPRRRPLSEVLRDRAARPGARRTQPDDTMQDRHFHDDAGGRDYRLFVPDRSGTALCGLVIMLHGCTQNPDDFARGTAMNKLAAEQGYVVAYPAQPRSCNMNGCWNWFEPAHQIATMGEPAILAGLAQSLQEEFGLTQSRTFVAGLSAGGAMAAILGELRPDVFAGVGVHSGLAPGSARDVASAFAAMRGDGARGRALDCPAIVFQGLSDPTVAAVNASRLVGVLQAPERRRETHEGRPCQITTGQTADGDPVELWLIEGAGHTWSGGDAAGSHTDARGPDASAEMLRFFNAIIEGRK